MSMMRFRPVPMFAPEAGAGAGEAAPAAGSGTPASLAAAAGIDPNKPGAADAGGAGAGQSEGAPAGTTPPAGAEGAGQPPVGAPYHPEGLAADLRGASDKETIDKLLAKATVRRAPETEAGYEFKLSETTTKLVGDIKDDPVVAVYRAIAREADLSNDQANMVFDRFFGQLVDKKLIAAPVDYDAELKALRPAGESDPQKAGAAATKRVQAGLDYVNGLVARRIIDQGEASMLFGVANSAKGVVMLEKLAAAMRQTPMAGGGAPPAPEKKSREALFFDNPTS